MGVRDLPPADARCASCFWSRRLDSKQVFVEDGREFHRTEVQLKCCFQRPPLVVLEDWLCPDWVLRSDGEAQA